jgi:hypothetical protein
MLPAQQAALSRSLLNLAALEEAHEDVTLRVTLADGSTVVGSLLSASADHLSLRLPDSQARRYSLEDIRSMHRARPRRWREWTLAGLGILAATAVLVGLASLPGLRSYLQGRIQVAFVVVFYLGVGLLALLLARTGLRNWLTRWESLADDPEQ